MVKILVTRPLPAAVSFAKILETQGYEAVIEPLLAVTPVRSAPPHMPGVGAVMITSGNALEALEADIPEIRALLTLPCFCVGPRTAEKAKAFGFTEVRHAEDGSLALASLIDESLGQGSSILHIAGQDTEGKGQAELEKRGHRIIPWIVYAATQATHLTPETINLLKTRQLRAVTVFSIRTAEVLKALLTQDALLACCEGLTAIGLSEAIAEALAPLPWRKRVAAAQPTQDAVIECLKQNCPVS